MFWLKRGYFVVVLILVTGTALLLALPYCAGAVGYCRLKKIDPARGVRFGAWWYGRVLLFLTAPVMPVCCLNPDMARNCGPCIIIPNHQSFLDLYLLAAQRCTNLCFVVTAWPFAKLCFFTAVMRRARYSRVGRYADGFDFIERCKAELQAGSTLVCFPEGTRSRTGQLLPFQSGVFRVAAATGARLVPMVFYNTGKICPPGSFRVNPQKIFVKMLEPINCGTTLASRQTHQTLRQQAREAMLAALSVNFRSAQ